MNPLLPLDQAKRLISQATPSLEPILTPLASANGCLLREDIKADMDLPSFDRSAMDGYAIAADDDASQGLKVAYEIQPGDTKEFSIEKGECARIFTGARIPEGANQVVIQEHVRTEKDKIFLLEQSDARYIRSQGEDAKKGEVLVPKGTRLHAAELSVLASVGAVNPLASRAPRVLHFTSGNELVEPSKVPENNQIRDSNSTLVKALLEDFGGRLVHQGRLQDNLQESLTMIEEVQERYDLLLLSGGASAGSYDYGRPLLEKLGFTILFQKIDLRPGRPLVFGKKEKQVAFVLPGNPVSHFVVFHHFVRLALERLEGVEGENDNEHVKAVLVSNLAYRPDKRITYWPAKVFLEEGIMKADPIRWNSSGDLKALVGVNGLIKLQTENRIIPEGKEVEIMLLGMPLTSASEF